MPLPAIPMGTAMLGSALIGGGATLASGFMGSSSARAQNEAARQMAREARAGQIDVAKHMALKGPKWQVDGLRAAGLNPLLAVSKGMPSLNVPGGVQAPVVGSAEPASRLMAGFSSALGASQSVSNVLKTLSETKGVTLSNDVKKNISDIAQAVSGPLLDLLGVGSSAYQNVKNSAKAAASNVGSQEPFGPNMGAPDFIKNLFRKGR